MPALKVEWRRASEGESLLGWLGDEKSNLSGGANLDVCKAHIWPLALDWGDMAMRSMSSQVAKTLRTTDGLPSTLNSKPFSLGIGWS